MSEQDTKPKRRLATIMASDVVGFLRLMQSDEVAVLAAPAVIRKATQSHIKQHR